MKNSVLSTDGVFPRTGAFALVFALATLVLPLSASADFVFYVTTERAGVDSELWVYDTDTDTHRLIGPSAPMHGLAFDDNFNLYGVSGRFDSSYRFFSFDLQNGDVTEISNYCCDRYVDLAFDPVGSTLYVMKNNGNLDILFPDTGARSSVGDGDGRRGFAIDSAGNAFQTGNYLELYSVDLGTGSTTNLGDITGLNYDRVMSLSFGSDDTLYGVDWSRCCSWSADLFTIDVTTRQATFVTSLARGAAAIAVTSSADTDEDSIADVFEIAAGLDPNDPNDVNEDGDGDGLTFLEEYELGTSDNNVDSDGDGLEDGDEVNVHGTDPTSTDTDLDGISDGAELIAGLDPLTPNNGRVELTGGDQPRHVNIAQDSTGRYHLVWSANDGTGEWRVYYGLLSATGAILIDGTIVSDSNDEDDAQPQIAVGADGRAHIIWHDTYSDTYFALVDPAGDTQDGDAADPGDIVVVAETYVSDYVHGQIAVDGAGNSFVVVEESGSEIAFLKIDNTGAVAIAETVINDSDYGYHIVPGVAVDDDGNVHLFWGQDSGLSYMMVQGSDGAILIDRTEVATTTGNPENNSTGNRAKFPNPFFGPDGTLYVVFGDKFGLGWEGGGQIFYLALDPSADDQDGSAASLAAITVTPKTSVSGAVVDPGRPWYPDGAIDGAGNMTVVWNGGGGGDVPETSDVRGTSLNLTTGELSGVTTLSTNMTHETADTSRIRPPHVAGNRVAFSDGFRVATVEFGTSASSGTQGSGTVTAGGLILFERIASGGLPTAAQTLPSGFSFPFDFYRLVISGLTPRQTTTLTLNLPDDLPAGAVVFKYTPATGWVQIPFTTGFAANQVLVQLTDGGSRDADGEANGVIVDPIAIGIPPPAPPPPPTTPTTTPVAATSSGGGCTMVATGAGRPIDPTLPVLLLLAIGFLVRRRLSGKV